MTKQRTSESTSMATALIYTRVSSEEQAREGVSLDAQLTECRRYAAQHGWVLGPEFQDVLSGKRDDRPAYQALLAEVRRLRPEGHSVVVVVFRLDPLGLVHHRTASMGVPDAAGHTGRTCTRVADDRLGAEPD